MTEQELKLNVNNKDEKISTLNENGTVKGDIKPPKSYDVIQILKFVNLLVSLLFGLWDEFSDVYYMIFNDIFDEDQAIMKEPIPRKNRIIFKLIFFFIFVSPAVQVLTYYYLFAKTQALNKGYMPPTQNKNADYRKQKNLYKAYFLLVRDFFKFYIVDIFIKQYKEILRAFATTLLMELKIFPFAVMYYINQMEIKPSNRVQDKIMPHLQHKRDTQFMKRQKRKNRSMTSADLYLDKDIWSQMPCSPTCENITHEKQQSEVGVVQMENLDDHQIREQLNSTKTYIDMHSKLNYYQMLSDENIEYIVRVGNIIEAFFEALPQAILQFVNNFLVHGSNWTTFQYLSFFTSIIVIFVNALVLTDILLGKKIDIFVSMLLHSQPQNFQKNKKTPKKQVKKINNEESLIQSTKDYMLQSVKALRVDNEYNAFVDLLTLQNQKLAPNLKHLIIDLSHLDQEKLQFAKYYLKKISSSNLPQNVELFYLNLGKYYQEFSHETKVRIYSEVFHHFKNSENFTFVFARVFRFTIGKNPETDKIFYEFQAVKNVNKTLYYRQELENILHSVGEIQDLDQIKFDFSQISEIENVFFSTMKNNIRQRIRSLNLDFSSNKNLTNDSMQDLSDFLIRNNAYLQEVRIIMNENMNITKTGYLALFSILKRMYVIENLELTFLNNKIDDECFEALTTFSVNNTLKVLKLSLQDNTILTDKAFQNLSNGLNSGLQELHLDFQKNSNFESDGFVEFGKKLLPMQQLEVLDLNFQKNNNFNQDSFNIFASNLGELENLVFLRLNLEQNNKLNKIQKLSRSLIKIRLQTMELNFQHNIMFSGNQMIEFFKQIGKMQALQKLALNFDSNTHIGQDELDVLIKSLNKFKRKNYWDIKQFKFQKLKTLQEEFNFKSQLKINTSTEINIKRKYSQMVQH